MHAPLAAMQQAVEASMLHIFLLLQPSDYEDAWKHTGTLLSQHTPESCHVLEQHPNKR
jgi:hypothetical protein